MKLELARFVCASYIPANRGLKASGKLLLLLILIDIAERFGAFGSEVQTLLSVSEPAAPKSS